MCLYLHFLIFSDVEHLFMIHWLVIFPLNCLNLQPVFNFFLLKCKNSGTSLLSEDGYLLLFIFSWRAAYLFLFLIPFKKQIFDFDNVHFICFLFSYTSFLCDLFEKCLPNLMSKIFPVLFLKFKVLAVLFRSVIYVTGIWSTGSIIHWEDS